MSEYIVVGDLHGCYDELIKLLTVVDYWNKPREIILVGDLIDKHSEPENYKKILKFVRENYVQVVLGNHEQTHLKFQRHYLNELKTGKPNPSARAKHPEKYEDFWRTRKALLEMEWDPFVFLSQFPYYYYIPGYDYVVVHGGLEKDRPPEKHKEGSICRVRRLKQSGKMASLHESTEDMPFWDEVYDGTYGTVLFGHAPVEIPRLKKYSIGLDTGAVFGNELSCFLLPEKRVLSVKSNKAYCENKYGWTL